MAERRFCPSCGENADTYAANRPDGRSEICCTFCGLGLSIEEAAPGARAERVLMADDSAAVRTLVTNTLTQKRLAGSVHGVPDGAAFLETATRWHREGRPPSLAILDVQMPGLDGFNAAAALRALERGFDAVVRVPILFVTARRIDPGVQAFLDALRPARYFNKGAATEPDQLGSRIEAIVSQMLRAPRE